MAFEHLSTNDFFDWDRIEGDLEKLKTAFDEAKPFRHVCIDGYFNGEFLQRILGEFPGPENGIWDNVQNPEIQVKLRSTWKTEKDISENVMRAVSILNSGRFLRILSRLTGLQGIITDPYFTGGGLNQIVRGGELAVHVDGNWHDLMGVHRRLNVILYLNDNWNPSWNGQLELWENDLSKCVKKVEPLLNRLVIFETSDFTYHGHPKPLTCPPECSRKSLIMYYYTSTRPQTEIKDTQKHRALFTKNRDLPRNP